MRTPELMNFIESILYFRISDNFLNRLLAESIVAGNGHLLYDEKDISAFAGFFFVLAKSVKDLRHGKVIAQVIELFDVLELRVR